MSTVSIILPVFNRQRHLNASIDSVLRQTHPDWNLVVIDDCSTDKSFQIACSYADIDKRISAVQLKTNSGNPAKARNLGMRSTDSKYIAFLDSDDTWNANKLSRQLQFMRSQKASFSFTGYNIISEQGIPIRTFLEFPNTLNNRQYLANTCLAPSTVVVEREKTSSLHFPENKKLAEDFVAFYELLKTQSAHGLAEALTNYRRSNDALSRSPMKMAWEQAKTYACISTEIGVIPAAKAYVGYAARACRKRTLQKKAAITRPEPS